MNGTHTHKWKRINYVVRVPRAIWWITLSDHMDYYLTVFFIGFWKDNWVLSMNWSIFILFCDSQYVHIILSRIRYEYIWSCCLVSDRSKSLKNKTKQNSCGSGLFKFPLTWIVTHCLLANCVGFKFLNTVEVHIMFISSVLVGICLYVLFLIHNLVAFFALLVFLNLK